ncbi:HAMP domain-containing histidine kinase [Hymenobacter lutimineralis]|uniref:histidine kinase n=1 Tax=Hymenobacter lutimineralis TaxID=2606448 RepID=A0A5D6VFS0_9BACT|nr:HAMP domain-containing sensor histidine kinase [Hymenobacter lutimineralis]TYZ14346.1 HAMP domain-containing histidine kinase [Hymenobacter lutimineralis]
MRQTLLFLCFSGIFLLPLFRAGASPPDSARVRQLRQLAQEQAHTNPDLSRATLAKALARARQTGDAAGERGVLNDLVDLNGRLNEQAAALRYLNAVQRLATRAQDTLELGRAYLYTAMLATEDVSRQVQFAELASQQFALLPRQPYWLLRAQSELATAYLAQKRLAAAKRVFRQAQQISQQLGEPGPEFRLLINWAKDLQAWEPDSARLLLDRARYLADAQLRTPYPRAYVRNVQAEQALKERRWPELVRLSAEAARLGRAARLPAVVALAQSNWAAGQRHLGQGAAAYDTLRKSFDAYEKLTAEDQRQEVARLQVRFDVERQQARIKALEQQRRVAGLRAERQRTRLYGLLGGLLAFGLLSLLLLLSRRRLQRSETQLREANQTKDQLMRIVGHDLRGPVASLQLLTPLLYEVLEQPERQSAHALVRTLDVGAQHLGGLIDNLFQWTRAQGGQLVNQPDRLRVADAVASIAALYAPAAELKHIHLHTTAPPDLLAWADMGLLTTVLRNLVGNALKFTPSGGEVTLQVAPAENGRVGFSVYDTGPGLPPERLHNLLTTERLESTPGTNGEPGTGLGLPLSARFVALMGGELHAGTAAGGGARLWFSVPGLPPGPTNATKV